MKNREVIRSEDYVNREFIQVDLNQTIRDTADVLCQLFSIGQQMLNDEECYMPLYSALWEACEAVSEESTRPRLNTDDDPKQVIR